MGKTFRECCEIIAVARLQYFLNTLKQTQKCFCLSLSDSLCLSVDRSISWSVYFLCLHVC